MTETTDHPVIETMTEMIQKLGNTFTETVLEAENLSSKERVLRARDILLELRDLTRLYSLTWQNLARESFLDEILSNADATKFDSDQKADSEKR